jgi:hypothetical protein
MGPLEQKDAALSGPKQPSAAAAPADGHRRSSGGAATAGCSSSSSSSSSDLGPPHTTPSEQEQQQQHHPQDGSSARLSCSWLLALPGPVEKAFWRDELTLRCGWCGVVCTVCWTDGPCELLAGLALSPA